MMTKINTDLFLVNLADIPDLCTTTLILTFFLSLSSSFYPASCVLLSFTHPLLLFIYFCRLPFDPL